MTRQKKESGRCPDSFGFKQEITFAIPFYQPSGEVA